MADLNYCVVGAGFAGLTAALRLKQAGNPVALLEARDRVGGRTFTEVATTVRGSTAAAPGSGRARTGSKALMNEFGVPSYKQYSDGEAMMVRRRQAASLLRHHSADDEPVGVGQSRRWSFSNWGRCASRSPWKHRGKRRTPQKWDQISLAKWLAGNTVSKAAHDLLETAIAGCYTSAASEVSMLFVPYQMASGGGPGFVLGIKDASQDSRIVGGMGAVYRPMAAEIGDSLHLSQPVRRIDQDADGVTVCSDDMTVRARRVVVAVPIAIAGQILVRADAPGGPVVPAPADAEWSDLQDQHRLRRAVLA